jgi:FeS assembly SUF system protein
MENANLQRHKELREKVVEAMRNIYDPEIPVNIYDLGLVYNIEFNDDDEANVRMTLTSPNCPVAESLPLEVEQKTAAVEGVSKANIHIVWEPPWTPEMMSEAAKLELNMF